MLSRVALVLGGSGALILTPAFAYSYFLAYGLPSETPPGWLELIGGRLADAGLVGESTWGYDRYGIGYLICWGAVFAGLVVALRSARPTLGVASRRAWGVIAAGVALVTVGVAGDYAVPNDVVGGIGFLLEGVGFLTAAAGTAYLGVGLRREHGASRPAAWLVGLSGSASVLAGTAFVGHIPSGPGVGFAAAAVLLGIRLSPLSGRQRDDAELGR